MVLFTLDVFDPCHRYLWNLGFHIFAACAFKSNITLPKSVATHTELFFVLLCQIQSPACLTLLPLPIDWTES